MAATASVRPLYATGFYPGDRASCLARLHACLSGPSVPELPRDLPATRLGGLVPHAGWVYSGPTAGLLWRALAESARPPEVVVLLGAVHVPFVSAPTVYDGHAWDSPLGPVAVDDRLRSALLSLGGPFLRPGSHAHEDEHALEVQIPFIRQLLPAASILPIAVPPDERAAALGRLVGEAVTADPRAVAVVASSDLTHYGRRYGFAPAGAGPGALEFGRRNDQLLLDRALALDPPGVLDEALSHHNACGPGALAACCAAMQVLGATERRLLQRTTSYDVKPDGDPGFFVGYASILFGTGKS